MKSRVPCLFLCLIWGAVPNSIVRAQPSAGGESALVTVPAIVSDVLASNREFKFYEQEIVIAKSGRRLAGAWNDPELSLDLGRKTAKSDAGVVEGEGTAWSVAVRQTFEWPGRIALRKAIANRQLELAELGLSRFRASLEARARTLAYTLYAANAKASALSEVTARFEALKETFLARDPAGITPLLETRVIEASELALQRRATEAQLALQAALIELNQLRGIPVTTPTRVATTKIGFELPPELGALMAAAREKNFEFAMRRVELEQQGLEVKLARNERYPSISVAPYVSQEKAGERETTVGVGVSIPLPISGRVRANGEIAEARRRQAETAMLVALRELEKEVATAAQAFSTKVAETKRWSPDSIQKFRDAAELADRHYRLGAVPIATYVELQSSYLAAVEALLDTEREAVEAGLRLQILTGLDLNTVKILP
jgi:outer membrane protein, heavy metal efflux system